MHISGLIKQKSYEKVVHVLRRHPITFVPTLLLLLILLAIPAILYFVIGGIFPTLLENKILYPISIIAASIYYLSILLFFFAQFIDFYLDVWILTNDRIVDIEQFGLFSRTISELDLFQIQDVTTDVHGFFHTFFHFGDVSVKTASTNVNVNFYNIPNPNKIRHELLQLAHDDRKFHYPESSKK